MDFAEICYILTHTKIELIATGEKNLQIGY